MTKVAEFSLEGETFSVISLGLRGAFASERDDEGELARFRLRDQVYAVVCTREQRSASSEPSASEVLTGRELQVAALVAQGMPNKQIAGQLHISEWTVCAHLRRIYSKLQVSGRAAMVFRCAVLVNMQTPSG